MLETPPCFSKSVDKRTLLEHSLGLPLQIIPYSLIIMSGTKRPASSAAPVPSITLQVNKADAEHFCRASNAIAAKMKDLSSSSSTSPPPTAPDSAEDGATTNTHTASLALHEKLFQAAIECNDEAVSLYKHRLRGSTLTQSEQKASFLLFDQAPALEEKMKAYFQAFGASKDKEELARGDVISLFRTLLTSITCCCGAGNSRVIVEGKPEGSPSSEPPLKKVKREEDTASTKESTQCASSSAGSKELEAPSFDSSLATVQDEEHGDIPKEIEEVSVYAADLIVDHAKEKTSGKLTATALLDWYQHKGSEVAPWLELLIASKWEALIDKKHPEPQPKDAPSPNKAKSSPDKPEAKPTTEKALPTTQGPPPPNHHQHPHQPHSHKPAHPPSMKEHFHPPPDKSPTGPTDSSPPLVSFDFSGSDHPRPHCIGISQNNISALRHLVHRTGLIHIPASKMCKKLMKAAVRRTAGDKALLTLSRSAWMRTIIDIIGGDVWRGLSPVEREAFTGSLNGIFGCFEGNKSFLSRDEVDLQEFAVGFCFFCEGSKSDKLSTGYEVLDDQCQNWLSEDALERYITAYLTTLVAMSVLAPISKHNCSGLFAQRHREEIRSAVESGAKWTLSHFLQQASNSSRESRYRRYTFESFATWYSSGGYQVAPWLELLDLNKLFLLITSDTSMPPPTSQAPTRDKMSSLRRHHSHRKGPPPEILFTFPLAKRQSLIVLKDDATYVKSVVDELDLLSMNPSELWSQINKTLEKQIGKSAMSQDKPVYLKMDTFLACMDNVCPKLKNNSRNHPARMKAAEILSNFFQCYDMERKDNVAVDELMGGLTLLCGGKKSHKLAFAFGVFDTRPAIQKRKSREPIMHSLSGEDLFLFLRSILIVTFSCCRQSLDMDERDVTVWISDTANMICNDVMRHQWQTRQTNRLNFDEFGQWYNEGGFERAPWLELLDLKKWVLIDSLDQVKKKQHHPVAPPPFPMQPPPPVDDLPPLSTKPKDPEVDVPPPPPEDALDVDFFDENGIMNMESIDEMDMILLQPSGDKDIDLGSPRIGQSFCYSPTPSFHASPPPPSPQTSQPPLKFHLSTSDTHGGYTLSLSNKRIQHLRRLLESSSLYKTEADTVCNRLLSKSSKAKNPKMTRENFDASIETLVYGSHPGAHEEENSLIHLLRGIFAAFDRENSGRASAIELSCGLTVLCKGKKSDKLEYAFDVLDKRKRGQLTREDMSNYLKSFLTVLLNIAFSKDLKDDVSFSCQTLTTIQGQACDTSPKNLERVIDAGAYWATTMAFEGRAERRGENGMSMSFDDFADWYTTKGYTSIPWLELLDLHKWVFSS